MKKKKKASMEVGTSRFYYIYDWSDHPASSVFSILSHQLGWNDSGKTICRIEELHRSDSR